ncbi:hypothetical protein I7I53_04024 [Histoplasma capsulatum var. duboisii H88]|uniref:Secreted protein n=1 Tax=Ajellomyces capsulatus (strain H88) TaxID=544711 RepID=A0A8A1LPQ6_AJEC8|nr:hypothetical protein I7I53_04024 [Histoplasma capsulatum var. duboisii H88]
MGNLLWLFMVQYNVSSWGLQSSCPSHSHGQDESLMMLDSGNILLTRQFFPLQPQDMRTAISRVGRRVREG